jgi:hypothetical protein
MSTSQTENQNAQLKSEAQNALTPDPWEAAYLRFETPFLSTSGLPTIRELTRYL